MTGLCQLKAGLSGLYLQSHLVSPRENMQGSHFLSHSVLPLSHPPSLFFLQSLPDFPVTDSNLSSILSTPCSGLSVINTKSYFRGLQDHCVKGLQHLFTVYSFRSQESLSKTQLCSLNVCCHAKVRGEV